MKKKTSKYPIKKRIERPKTQVVRVPVDILPTVKRLKAEYYTEWRRSK